MSAGASSRPGAIPHLPALDGLRGLALLGVLAFHSRKLLVGGYLGVDLFFVLSGYLITSLLISERAATGTIALGAFWLRRARRLLPALVSLMPAIALYAWLVAQPDELDRIRNDALATLAYVANWSQIYAHRSYWDLFAAPSPLEHTWSLAIEEQFYLIWPLVAVFAKGNAKTIRTVALAGIAASMATMFALYTRDTTSRVYFGTDTRATALFAGIALAAVLPPTTRFTARGARILDALGLVAAVGLAFAWWKLAGESRFLYRGGFWLTELAALVLIACAVCGPSASIVARVLAARPLVFVGLISYGLYLWHWPIDVVVRAERLHVSIAVARVLQVAATFAVAIASYYLVERPIRTRGLPTRQPGVAASLAVVGALALVVGSTRPRPRPPHPELAFASPDPVDDAPRLTLMLEGDSTANSLGWTLRGVRKPGVTVELAGQDGCSLLTDGCRADQWKADVARVKPDVTILFPGGAFLHPWENRDGDLVRACDPEWNARFERVLESRLPDLVAPAGAKKTRTFVVTVPKSLRPFDGKAEQAEIACINETLKKAVLATPGVELLDFGGRVCPNGECPVREPNVEMPIRPDGIHYDMAGAQPAATWVLEQIVAAQ